MRLCGYRVTARAARSMACAIAHLINDEAEQARNACCTLYDLLTFFDTRLREMIPSNLYRRRRFLIVASAVTTITLLVVFGTEYTTTVPVSLNGRGTDPSRRIPVRLPPSSSPVSSSASRTRNQAALHLQQRQQSRIDSIREAAALERQKINDAIQDGYGVDAYEAMFFLGSPRDKESSVGRHFFGPFNATVEPFNRSKFLLVSKLVRGLLGETERIPLVWATGGNSVAAGHGNLFNESYTQVLMRAVTPAFQAAGLDFTSRLYASSGTQSAPETAFCHEAIYGTDVDILVWDFSLTDGRRVDGNYNKLEWYLTRAATTRSAQPKILLALNVYDDPKRLAILQRLADRGLAVLYSRQDVMDHVVANIPDTMGRSHDEISAMPRLIQKFKCGGGKNGKMELNEPFCLKSDKFNPVCSKRLYQVSWHPGWKWNALLANLLALFVVELLDEAIREVSTAVSTLRDLNKWLNQIEAEQQTQWEYFRQTDYHESLKAIVDPSEHDTIDWNLLVKGSVYCHLSILPSETRRKGIVTNNTNDGLNIYSRETGAISRELVGAKVDQSDKSLASVSPQEDTMRLVYEANDKNPQKFQCDHQLHIDFKEYFYVDETDGWRHVIVPNKAEEREYGTGAAIRTGMVAICLKWCNWNECPKGNIDIAGIRAGNATVEINGQLAVSLTPMVSSGQECFIASNDQGRNWTPNHEGRFVIRARVEVPNSFVRFTSFIVWYDNL